MPYTYVEPDLFLEHNGVEIFHTYKEGTDEPSPYWFTTDLRAADEVYDYGAAGHFDVRRFAGFGFTTTPTVGQWNDWWKPRFKTEDDAILALIKSAIEDGRLPHSEAFAS